MEATEVRVCSWNTPLFSFSFFYALTVPFVVARYLLPVAWLVQAPRGCCFLPVFLKFPRLADASLFWRVEGCCTWRAVPSCQSCLTTASQLNKSHKFTRSERGFLASMDAVVEQSSQELNVKTCGRSTGVFWSWLLSFLHDKCTFTFFIFSIVLPVC